MVLAKLKKVARVSLYVVGVGILVVFTCQQLTSKHFVYSSTWPENNAKVALIGIKGSPGSNSSHKHTLPGTTTLLQDECRSVEPWFSEKTKTSRKQVIFYGKPSMHVIKRICMARHWRMTVILNNSASRLKDLTRLVMQDDIFTILITSSKLHHLKLIQDLSNSQNALVSSIRYAFKISGKKKVQLKSFRRAFENHGCSLESARIMPRSFLLDNPQDCIQFFKYAGLREDSWWVLKPSEGYGGDGITMHPNLTQIHREFGTCSERNNEYVVQEYLSNMLLIEKRKFDVRGLVVIAGTTPYFLFYHEGYLRVSVHTFDFKGDRAAHLTNSHVQVMSNDFLPEKHFWSFQRFQEYLDTYHPGQEDFVDNRLVPFIKKIALFILQAGINVFSRSPSSYQLLGLDFMVTDDFHIWFIEVNNYPLWPKGSPFVNDLMDRMGNNLFDLLFELRHTPSKFMQLKPGHWYRSWQLVWSELDANCSNSSHYNSCEPFQESKPLV